MRKPAYLIEKPARLMRKPAYLIEEAKHQMRIFLAEIKGKSRHLSQSQ